MRGDFVMMPRIHESKIPQHGRTVPAFGRPDAFV